MSSKPAGAARSPRKRWGIAALVAVALALVLGVGTAWAEATFAKADYRWYTDNPDATEFVITTGPQMQGLANLVSGSVGEDEGIAVNGPIDFAGKTVRLGTSVNLGNLFGTREFTPIGTDEHPFQGTFDGAGNTVKGMRITSEQGLTKDIGMFGVVGDAGLIRNVNMEDSCLVEIASVEQDNRIEDVGAIVGENRGSMENCTSAAHINVTYTPEKCTGKVIRNIGGLAGSVQGTVTGCSFSGQLRADTPVNAYEENNESVAYVAENFGGVVGYIYGDLSSSSNSGNLIIVTSGQSGVDRFGSKVEAKAEYIGGVAGYCMSNVDDCHNVADLFATSKKDAKLSDMYGNKSTCDPAVFKSDGGGNGMGGVVGSLRGIAKSGAGDFRTDPGVEGPDAEKHITMSNCTNTGYVSGLHTVGGVAGTAGSYTLVTRCVNGIAGEDPSSDVGHVRTTRWNKPGCGGVVGQSWGNTSYCRNHGTVENTRSGYYSAGIVGMIELHETTAVQKETPEVWACYNTGNVFTDGGALTAFREGAIVGQNNGYVHDNVYLWGTVSTNVSKLTDDNQVAIGGQYATEANNVAMYNTQAQAEENEGYLISSGEAVSVLNTAAPNGDWADYYYITSTTNNGYPVLNGEGAPDSSIDLSKVACALTFVKNAPYTAAYNPIPKLKASITVDGEVIELLQGSDFIVIPDADALDESGVCKGLTNGKQPYRAKIQGIGNYVGQSVQSVSYGIDKGNFAECRVMANSVRYTGNDVSAQAKVTVLDAGGALVDAADYSYTVNDGNKCVNATGVAEKGYRVEATATPDAKYQGTSTGYFRIETVDIYRDVDVIGLEYGNRVWFYDETQTGLYEVIPTHADGTPIDQEAGEKLEYYQIPLLDEAGNQITDDEGNVQYATHADGTIAQIPYVARPTSFNEEDYQVNGNFVTYVSEEGRTLTVAEPKYKNENGTPVYNDMTLDYEGKKISPKVIGALLDGEWLTGIADGTVAANATSEEQRNAAWKAVYGGTSSGDSLPRPQNTNRTTKDDTPEASVLVNGNSAAGYSNLTYMDFRIAPIKISNENVKVVRKPNYKYYERQGEFPGVPANTKAALGDYAFVNPAYEVRYAPDPEVYDPNNESTYYVMDVANWELVFDHAETANGELIAPDNNTEYVAGCRAYFKVKTTGEASSLLGWTEVSVSEPLTILDPTKETISLSDPVIQIEVEPAVYDYENPTAGLRVTDSASNHALVPGEDFYIVKQIGDNGYPVNGKLDFEQDTTTGYFKLPICLLGTGNYEGYSDNFDLLYLPGTANLGNLSAKMAGPYGSLSTTTLGYKPGGWTLSDINDRLYLCGYIFDTKLPVFRQLSTAADLDREGLKVDIDVTKLQTGTSSKPNATSNVQVVDTIGTYYYWTGTASASDSSIVSDLTGSMKDSARRLRMTKQALVNVVSKFGIFRSLEFEHEYTYTGEEPDFRIHLIDNAGRDWGEKYCNVFYPQPQTECTSVGEYNTPTWDNSAVGSSTCKYDDRLITGDGTYYSNTAPTNPLNWPDDYKVNIDLQFKIVPADISDGERCELILTSRSRTGRRTVKQSSLPCGSMMPKLENSFSLRKA